MLEFVINLRFKTADFGKASFENMAAREHVKSCDQIILTHHVFLII